MALHCVAEVLRIDLDELTVAEKLPRHPHDSVLAGNQVEEHRRAVCEEVEVGSVCAFVADHA